MVLKALISLTRKKTLEEYRHYMMTVSLSFLFVAASCLLISFFIKTNDFAAGLLLVGGVAGLVVAIYYVTLTRQPNRLKAYKIINIKFSKNKRISVDKAVTRKMS